MNTKRLKIGNTKISKISKKKLIDNLFILEKRIKVLEKQLLEAKEAISNLEDKLIKK